MSRQPIDVAICLDRNIEGPALVFLASLRAASDPARHVVVHVVTDGLSARGEAAIRGLERRAFAIDFIKVANVFSHFGSLGHISSGTYLRFMLPDLLRTCKRVLYLDVDIVVRRDVSDLFDTDLDGLAVAAVPDFSQLNSGLTWRPWRIDYQGRAYTFADYLAAVLGLQAGSARPYFNCGVMLLDLDVWRSQRIVERTVEILREKPGLRFLDQDALNETIGENYKVLDARWNALATNAGPWRLHWRDRWRASGRKWLAVRNLWQSDPWIIHFAGPGKPWQKGADPTLLDAYWWKAAAELQPATPPAARHGGQAAAVLAADAG